MLARPPLCFSETTVVFRVFTSRFRRLLRQTDQEGEGNVWKERSVLWSNVWAVFRPRPCFCGGSGAKITFGTTRTKSLCALPRFLRDVCGSNPAAVLFLTVRNGPFQPVGQFRRGDFSIFSFFGRVRGETRGGRAGKKGASFAIATRRDAYFSRGHGRSHGVSKFRGGGYGTAKDPPFWQSNNNANTRPATFFAVCRADFNNCLGNSVEKLFWGGGGSERFHFACANCAKIGQVSVVQRKNRGIAPVRDGFNVKYVTGRELIRFFSMTYVGF